MSIHSVALSVVIPCYNQGEYLLDALTSVQACLDPVYEIIIVNDGSTDPITNNLLSYLKEQGYFVLDQENQGLSGARNSGIAKASGRYILTLDADNKIRANYILKGIEVLDQNSDVGVVYGKPEWFGEIERPWGMPEQFDPNQLLLGNYIDACAVFRKSIWEDCGGYDTHLPVAAWEDWDFWLGVLERGWKFHYIPEVLYDYRVRKNSMVATCDLPENRSRLLKYICTKHAKLYRTAFAQMVGDRELQVGNLQVHCNNLTRHRDDLAGQLERAHAQLKQAHNQLQQTQNQFHHTQHCFQEAQNELQRLTPQLQHTQRLLEHSNTILQWMETSKFWKLRLAFLKAKRLALRTPPAPATPVIPPQLPSVQKHESDQPQRHSNEYDRWREAHVPRPADLQKLAETIELMPRKPLISIIVPVFNTPEPYLRAAINSVLDQIYPHWELCLADDASTEPHVRQVLEFYEAQDSRIKVAFRTTNGHISHCSNSALALATGEFVALLDHDDLLTPDALYEVALLINRQPEVDLIYSDEDKLDDQETLREPFFKPDWCPDSFLSRMYICHLGVYRRSLVEAIGGFRPGFEGSQDYDMALRFTEKTDRIAHIPKVLYHWRIHPASAASSTEAKPYAYQAAEKALLEALQRRGTPGKIVDSPTCLGHYIVRYQIESPERVSIIIPTKDLSQTLHRCLESIFKQTTYPDYEVIVIDNGSVEEETFDVIHRWSKSQPHRFKCYPLDIPFNYSKLNNYAVTKAQGKFLLFLNNDTEVITPDWITAMVEQAQRPTIGAVGVQLLYSDNTIQHAGVIAGLGGVAGHSHQHFLADEPGYFNQIQTVSNCSAVTAACLMCRRDVFLAVGGFEEQLAIAFNDVDLCFKMLDKGYRNIYLPHVKLYHYESKSRGMEDTPEKQARFEQEVAYMQQKWHSLIEHDPCYSPHLTRRKADFSLRI
ncbi:MAG: glycosyltransferase [Leptolyngbya sp. BL-A-14]